MGGDRAGEQWEFCSAESQWWVGEFNISSWWASRSFKPSNVSSSSAALFHPSLHLLLFSPVLLPRRLDRLIGCPLVPDFLQRCAKCRHLQRFQYMYTIRELQLYLPHILFFFLFVFSRFFHFTNSNWIFFFLFPHLTKWKPKVQKRFQCVVQFDNIITQQ